MERNIAPASDTHKGHTRLGRERLAALKLISVTCGLGLITLWRLEWQPNPVWMGGVALGWGWALGALAFPALGRPWVKVYARLESGFRFAVTALSLGLAFFLVITPLAWAGKLFGRGFLEAKSGAGRTEDGTESYWKERKAVISFWDGKGAEQVEVTREQTWNRPY